ncbi:MAG TPA: hypothetical protein O0X64_01060 [Methanocorpusculum sp.]|nr:hypothetical protein [Methanocorpusculum sp.]HJJ91144.1 hypothetical protein [Methanocorpusculum sp.]HJJ92401.1 hypothetical protein [Methanocorpusculum sp.]
MGSEVYQAQILRAFFDTITGTDRNLTRIYMCVISLAKLRGEKPEKLRFLMEQMQASREKRELSIDILDYMVEVANSLESGTCQSAFGITSPMKSEDFGGISMDSF